MQYGMEVYPYERVKKKAEAQKKKYKVKLPLYNIMFFLLAILISRVTLITTAAPFGIALLLAVMMLEKQEVVFYSALGTVLGYLTVLVYIKGFGVYGAIIITLLVFNHFLPITEKKSRIFYYLGAAALEIFLYKVTVLDIKAAMAFAEAFFEAVTIFPLYYILRHSIICFKEIKTPHLFSGEELISMTVLAALIIAGFRDISLYGISLRNITAMTLIVILAYVRGAATGAAAGVTLGFLVGLPTDNLFAFASIYSVCGLLVGAFRESGKLFSFLAYVIIFAVAKFYGGVGGSFKVVEALICGGIFLAIPAREYKKLALEIDFDKKYEDNNERYGDRIKNIILKRLDSFSEVLSGMSGTLQGLVDNDNLEMKNKSATLVQTLADRVCENCSMNNLCWNREQYYTYNSFSELIQNYQDNKKKLPFELQRKCVRRTQLTKNTEDIVNNYIINEMHRNRLNQGRELIASQIYNMAGTVGDIVEEFASDIEFNEEAEIIIRRVFKKEGIAFKEVLCYKERNERLVIKLALEACGGANRCVKEVLPILNSSLNKIFSVCEEGCEVNRENRSCGITIEETPKYYVASHGISQCKEGEQTSGDSFTHFSLKDGTYMTLLSDGMGSGPQANKESSAAINMIEKFAKAGFSKSTAINTVNSILGMKFSADEKYSTLDMNVVDLYNGTIEFVKVGAAQSFIKSGSKVKIVKSRSLPMGILDKVDVEVIKEKLKHGDFIITLSDGILDCCPEVDNIDWLMDLLKDSRAVHPKDVAEEILQKAKELCGGKIKDDMTVVVSKIYNLF